MTGQGCPKPLAKAGKDGQPQGQGPKSASRETCQREPLETGRGVPVTGFGPFAGLIPPSDPRSMIMGLTDMTTNATELLVCVKCRKGQEIPDDDRRPGQALYDGMTELDAPEGVRITPVECLQNCDFGCTVALRGGDLKWTYVFANVDEMSHPEMILSGAAQYHRSTDGVIPWRERPEHFKRNCVARIPPMTAPQEA